MRVLLILCFLTTLALARPGIRFGLEKAKEKLQSLPMPKHDPKLAQRVSDCIAGTLRDEELCQSSILKFNSHLQDMYLRTLAIHQAEEATKAALEEAETLKQEVKNTVKAVDPARIPVKPRV